MRARGKRERDADADRRLPPHPGMGLALCVCARRALRGANTPSLAPPASLASPFLPVAVTMPLLLAVALDAPPAPPGDPRSCWSSAHRSPNFSLSPEGRVALRAPAEQSTDGIRGAVGERGGLHVWQVDWDPAERGNRLWHDDAPVGLYPRRRSGDVPLRVPSTVLVVLDADAGTLGFVVDGCFLGTAFWGLPHGTPLFPAVSSVRGGCRIALRYLNGSPRESQQRTVASVSALPALHVLGVLTCSLSPPSGEPPSLVSLCRLCVRRAVGRASEAAEDHVARRVDRMELPPALRRLFLYSPHTVADGAGALRGTSTVQSVYRNGISSRLMPWLLALSRDTGRGHGTQGRDRGHRAGTQNGSPVML
ncbi:SPRY domain-containing SOCS box protein 1-like [Scleropages formosus]|uniref:SPRY domain-containing SOCS box protein 1-like n=1 Tax=Scleropages formosus TaxID=113540 RepID=A0A0P7UJF4_SCLFO|nr:SPRY domain-containing SOCS box protein 1-like [Scleropages formosus]